MAFEELESGLATFLCPSPATMPPPVSPFEVALGAGSCRRVFRERLPAFTARLRWSVSKFPLLRSPCSEALRDTGYRRAPGQNSVAASRRRYGGFPHRFRAGASG